MATDPSARVTFAPVEGAARLFTPAFCAYLTRLHDGLDARARALRAARRAAPGRAPRAPRPPGPPPPPPAPSGGHRLVDTVRAAHNRLAAVNRELGFEDTERGKSYRIAPGELPFFMHRERGMHLDEPDVTGDGTPIPAAILGTALTLFYSGPAQVERGQGIYFYLPKLESSEECKLYRDLFDLSRAQLPFLKNAVIKAIILVESLPCVYEMEEMLYA